MASIKFFEQNMLCGILPYAHCTVEYITIELPYPICSSKREKKKKKKRYILTEVLLEMFTQSTNFLH